MLSVVFSGLVLMLLTVVVHAAGIALLVIDLRRFRDRMLQQAGGIFLLLLRAIRWLVLIHLAEIGLWGAFFLWRGCLPDAETAFYFSGVTYTSVGYGDVVLARPWRLLGPAESLMGVLMCGLSAGLLFAIMSTVYHQRMQKEDGLTNPSDL